MTDEPEPCLADCPLCVIDKEMDAHWDACKICSLYDAEAPLQQCAAHDEIADRWNERFDELYPPECEGTE